ncbi:hypothetical protein ABC977_02490 [Thioalkalicoccus limnaeus]|uniref:Dynamin family protein n=1 Tax=Thioalkalicoccus limnaeus TaxID=120681 RepID=A0ABV4BA35_9GAMM
MSSSPIQQGVELHREWKTRVLRAIAELREGLRRDPGATALIQDTFIEIERDRLELVVVTNAPQGGADLLRALLWSDREPDWIPADARYCPPPIPITFLWDEACGEAYLRLLPIATRDEATPLDDDGQGGARWVQYPLTYEAPTQRASALEVDQNKAANESTTTHPSLLDVLAGETEIAESDETPRARWRQALVSLRHPLLEKGLVITLAPTLTGLDREPAIATQILHRAQAVLFILDVERGLSATDLAIWQRHLSSCPKGAGQALIVGLDRSGPPTNDSTRTPLPNSRIEQVRDALRVGPNQAVSIASRLALTACRRGDALLMRHSGLPNLEQALISGLLEAKHQAIIERLDDGIGRLSRDLLPTLSARITENETLLEELIRLQAKSAQTIGRLTAQTQAQQEAYLQAVTCYQASRERIMAAAAPCHAALSRHSIDALIEQGHREMVLSWTTRGLASAMKGLFDRLRARMQRVADQSETLRSLVRETYQEFGEIDGFDLLTPRVFVPTRFHVELELLYQEVELYHRSPALIFSEQARVIERFHEQMVSRARVLFDQLARSVDPWIRDALLPIADAIEQHRTAMERGLEELARIAHSSKGLEQRIVAMRAEQLQLNQQLTALRLFERAVDHTPRLSPELETAPDATATSRSGGADHPGVTRPTVDAGTTSGLA